MNDFNTVAGARAQSSQGILVNGALQKGGYAGHEVRVLQKENYLILVNCFDFSLQSLEYALWRVSG